MMTYRPLDVFDTSYYYDTTIRRVRDVKTFVRFANTKKNCLDNTKYTM